MCLRLVLQVHNNPFKFVFASSSPTCRSTSFRFSNWRLDMTLSQRRALQFLFDRSYSLGESSFAFVTRALDNGTTIKFNQTKPNQGWTPIDWGLDNVSQNQIEPFVPISWGNQPLHDITKYTPYESKVESKLELDLCQHLCPGKSTLKLVNRTWTSVDLLEPICTTDRL